MSSKREAVDKVKEGRRLVQSGDYQGAVAVLTEAIALSPNFPYAYLSRAEAYGELGHEDLAKADSERRRCLSPGPSERATTSWRGVRQDDGDLE